MSFLPRSEISNIEAALAGFVAYSTRVEDRNSESSEELEKTADFDGSTHIDQVPPHQKRPRTEGDQNQKNAQDRDTVEGGRIIWQKHGSTNRYG